MPIRPSQLSRVMSCRIMPLRIRSCRKSRCRLPNRGFGVRVEEYKGETRSSYWNVADVSTLVALNDDHVQVAFEAPIGFEVVAKSL